MTKVKLEAEMIRKYLKEISELVKLDPTEGSHYANIANLFKNYAKEEKGFKEASTVILPQRTDIGTPDIRVYKDSQYTVGYIEAKDPRRVNTLTTFSHSFPEDYKRFKKYKDADNMNIILTNALEFELYLDGKKIGDTVFLANLTSAGKIQPTADGEKQLRELMDKFFKFSLPETYSPEKLAETLAKRTIWLHDAIKEVRQAGNDVLNDLYKGFKEHLVSFLEPNDFDDLMAQTVTFGLLASRYKAPKGKFNRDSAYRFIPPTIKVLRELFIRISTTQFPDSMEWVIEDLVDIFKVADVPKMFKDYYTGEADEDPIFYFYQVFLRKFDPHKSEQLGVYYTPEPVISYIVRSVNSLLKKHFGRKYGLAGFGDPERDKKAPVKILDPAGGTLGFLAFAAKEAVKNYPHSGAVKDWIKPHVLDSFYAFELMMAPYTLGHLKMAFTLEELGCPMEPNDRINLYLTNTLDMPEERKGQIQLSLIDPVIKELDEESKEAAKVKCKDTPILVVIGNPPYSGISNNPSKERVVVEKGGEYYSADKKPNIVERNGRYELDWDAVKQTSNTRKEVAEYTWIGRLIQDYKIDDGEWFGEVKHWLNDDYVKFIRFSQWKINQLGEGVLGFITNHGYIDNPTFRGMRQSLMADFNEIHILDLHGSTLKKELCPDGSTDQNVFDIKTGVAIILLVKTTEGKGCKVYHKDLWGLRQNYTLDDSNTKYGWLKNNEVDTTEWTDLEPKPPLYFFCPRDDSLDEIYDEFISVVKVFPKSNVGIVTARDKLTIGWTEQEIWERVSQFAKMEVEEARRFYDLGKDARDWKVEFALKDVNESGPNRELIQPILYRPFDVRNTYYTGVGRGFIGQPIRELMTNMIECEELGLVTCKRISTGNWNHILVTNLIIESSYLSTQTSEIGYLAPLYLYDPKTKTKTPNLNQDLISSIEKALNKKPTPEEILYYIYAVLHSPIYREKYNTFLKSDFPRVPFTINRDLFEEMAIMGEHLVNLHLLKNITPTSKYKGEREENSLKIENLPKNMERHDPKTNRVYINQDQYFTDVSSEVWNYRIGGYQVLSKWLRERGMRRKRADQSLWIREGLDEIGTFCKVIEALRQTIVVQGEIDKIYPKIENAVIAYGNSD